MPHIHDKVDFTVEVFIVYKNKVLLRKHDKYKMWLSVGGHIELDEDPNQAAVREVKEEVGLDIEIFSKDIPLFNLKDYKELIPPKFLDRHRINPNHEHVVLVYFAKSFTDKIKQSEDELSEECKWFTKEEIDNPSYGIKEDIRFYAKKALEELGVKD
ncbi:MAG: NUDIX domain-containing protein [Candidatus Nanoarchaeia archaeon]|nr:NUDIX domain-containing protein [Candidatus Nanoarchaeia archaeon]MDD5741271.1 NUDIX domain-containing protein [Candidatus Nanoarchaeia archaeon]